MTTLFSADDATRELVEQFGFSHETALEQANRIARYPQLLEAFATWLADRRTLPDVTIGEYSLDRLVNDQMLPLQAFFWLTKKDLAERLEFRG